MSALDAVRAHIHRSGPIGFDTYMSLALDGEDGFFASGRGAGRAGGDFVTSPQVGALFGRLVARAFDREWEVLGRPDPFVVIEGGAGDGTLARDVLRAEPACATALHYVLVERSVALRRAQHDRLAIEPPDEALGPFVRPPGAGAPEPVPGRGPIVTQLADLPAVRVDGVVFANELLDNLPIAVVERNETGWSEVRVTLAGATELPAPILVPLESHALLTRAVRARAAQPGTRLPVPVGALEWVERANRTVERGALVLVDYFATTDELVERAPAWLRTYAGHRRGHDPFVVAPGNCDITADVPLEPICDLGAGATVTTQAEWLAGLGAGAEIATARAHLASATDPRALHVLAARSTINEAAALTDPAGLGAHRVVRLARSPR